MVLALTIVVQEELSKSFPMTQGEITGPRTVVVVTGGETVVNEETGIDNKFESRPKFCQPA